MVNPIVVVLSESPPATVGLVVFCAPSGTVWVAFVRVVGVDRVGTSRCVHEWMHQNMHVRVVIFPSDCCVAMHQKMHALQNACNCWCCGCGGCCGRMEKGSATTPGLI